MNFSRGKGMRVFALAAAAALWSGAASAAVLSSADITDPTTQFFNPANGHVYEVVNQLATWQEAFGSASAKSLSGVGGHLVTITSARENEFVYGLVSAHVNTGWDFGSAWIGLNSVGSDGEWRWADGPEAGVQIWQGYASGSAIPGTYNNLIVGDLYDVNSACAGSGSGCWWNPTGSGAEYAFLNGTHWRPGGWGIGYSSPTATTTASSPIAGAEGMRNAYVIEYSAAAVPEPSSWALLIGGFGIVGIALRRRLGRGGSVSAGSAASA